MSNPANILVVSCDVDHRRALEDILGTQGWGTVSAADITECRHALVENRVWLIFCEQELPDGKYDDVLTIVDTLNENVPVVVTSRLADWDEYLKALDRGAFDLIASPCEPAEVIRLIEQARTQIDNSGISAPSARAASVGCA